MLAKHGVTYLVIKLFPAVLSLLSLVIFTRILTPGQYGVYSLTILIAGLGSAVLLQWISLGVGRYLPASESSAEKENLLATARTVSLCISMVLITLTLTVFFSGYFISYAVVIWVVGFLCAMQGWNDLNLKIQNASLNPGDYGKILTLKSAVGFALGVFSAYLGFGAEGILISTVIGLFVASLLNRSVWSINLPWLFIDSQQLRRLFIYGAPLTVTYLLIFIIDASDRFFIERMIGIDAVGIYSAAYELSQYSIGTLTSVVHLAALPLILSMMAKYGVKGAQEQLKKTFLFILAVALPASGGMAIIAPDIAYSLMGSSFSAEAEIIIPWIALAMFLSSLKSFYFDYAFQLAQSTQTQMFIVFVCALVNLALNYWLIGALGTVGAAISTVIAFAVGLLLSWRLGRRVYSMPRLPYKEASKLCVAFMGMVLVISMIHMDASLYSLIVKVLVGGGSYALILAATNMWGIKSILVKKLRGLVSSNF